MIRGYLIGYDHAQMLLPAPLRWELCRTDGAENERFLFVFPFSSRYSDALRSATRFRALEGSTDVMQGIVDSCTVSMQPDGQYCTISGRGMGALLEDCEHPARFFFDAALDDILSTYVTPLGITSSVNASLFVSNFSVGLGMNSLQILRRFCADAGALPPRFLTDGRISISKTRNVSGHLFHEGMFLSAARSERRSGIIGQLHIVEETGVQTYENTGFLAEGGQCERYSSQIAASLRPEAQIQESMRQRRTLCLTLAGNIWAEPGESTELQLSSLGIQGTFYITQCICIGSTKGLSTEIHLAQY